MKRSPTRSYTVTGVHHFVVSLLCIFAKNFIQILFSGFAFKYVCRTGFIGKHTVATHRIGKTLNLIGIRGVRFPMNVQSFCEYF